MLPANNTERSTNLLNYIPSLQQDDIKVALAASGYQSLQDWCQDMLDPDTDCDLLGVIGLRKLTNVTPLINSFTNSFTKK